MSKNQASSEDSEGMILLTYINIKNSAMKKTNLKTTIANSSINIEGVVVMSLDDKIVSVVYSDNFRKDVLECPDFDSFDVTNVASFGGNYKFFNKIITENNVEHNFCIFSKLIEDGSFFIDNEDDDIFFNRMKNVVTLFLKFPEKKRSLQLDLPIHYLFDSMSNVIDFDLPVVINWNTEIRKGEVVFTIDGDEYKTAATYFFDNHVSRKNLRAAVKYFDRRQQELSRLKRAKQDSKNKAA